MTASHTAWLLYLERVQTLIDLQHTEFEQGGKVSPVKLFGPTANQVALIQQALDFATKQAGGVIVHKALRPIVDALDTIDNSRLKNAMIKECRAGIQRAYEELHTLKDSVDEKTS